VGLSATGGRVWCLPSGSSAPPRLRVLPPHLRARRCCGGSGVRALTRCSAVRVAALLSQGQAACALGGVRRPSQQQRGALVQLPSVRSVPPSHYVDGLRARADSQRSRAGMHVPWPGAAVPPGRQWRPWLGGHGYPACTWTVPLRRPYRGSALRGRSLLWMWLDAPVDAADVCEVVVRGVSRGRGRWQSSCEKRAGPTGSRVSHPGGRLCPCAWPPSCNRECKRRARAGVARLGGVPRLRVPSHACSFAWCSMATTWLLCELAARGTSRNPKRQVPGQNGSNLDSGSSHAPRVTCMAVIHTLRWMCMLLRSPLALSPTPRCASALKTAEHEYTLSKDTCTTDWCINVFPAAFPMQNTAVTWVWNVMPTWRELPVWGLQRLGNDGGVQIIKVIYCPDFRHRRLTDCVWARKLQPVRDVVAWGFSSPATRPHPWACVIHGYMIRVIHIKLKNCNCRRGVSYVWVVCRLSCQSTLV